MAITRVQDQPAYVLHRYDWSESSLILDVWTPEHGRLALVAKGAKKPASQFRPILLSMPPLVTWSYQNQPELGSAEHRLYTDYLKPKAWI